MVPWWTLILAAVIGSWIGVILIAVLTANRRE